jgi:putative spermidine/putrescine transport system ATP-binding protein
MSKPFLQIRGIRKEYGPVTAVHDVNLDVAQGEFLTFLGPSGSGKSTTLYILAGFEDPTRGDIVLNGQSLLSTPSHKRNIGMVFQRYTLFPHLSVGENIAFPLKVRRLPKAEVDAKVAKMLKLVRLEGFEDRKPAQMSGGQQQRVALARALVIEPRLLLLDEPLANLDAVLREDMRVFIRELQKRVGITTLYVTHDQAEAMVMSDRVAVMLGGRLQQFDVPEAIYLRPRSGDVARFIGRSNLIEGRVESKLPDEGAWLRFRIDTALGTVEADHDQPLAPGQTVQVTIRPEAIHFDACGPYQGQVATSYFLGSSVEHTVQCAGGQTLLVQTAPGQRVAAGASSGMRFEPGHAWIIAGQE